MSHQERLAVLETEQDEIAKLLGHFDEQTDKLVGWANRWKGSFAVILGVEAFIGWFADKLSAFLSTRGHANPGSPDSVSAGDKTVPRA